MIKLTKNPIHGGLNYTTLTNDEVAALLKQKAEQDAKTA
jgi:hypothetical protein